MLIILAGIGSLLASGKPYYFYKPENTFGSDLMFNPITLVIDGSFDILRNGSHTKDVFAQPYADGFRNVCRNITSPGYNIEQYGKSEFLQRELFNLSLNADRSQFMPNISLHVMGNGMQYVKLAEWYDYREYSNPYLLSALTTIFYQFVNEIVENGAYQGPNVDPIADVLIFNTLGFTLFSFDFAKRFFSESMPLYDWSPQPFYNLVNHFLENAGQQYASKIKVLPASRYKAFVYFGVYSIFGVSVNTRRDENLSFGAGAVVYRLTENRFNGSRLMTPNMDKALGFFYDKNNSLLGSAILTGPDLISLKIEVYPGWLKIGNFKPGFLVEFGGVEGFQFGLSTEILPFGLIGAL